jgi:hypothetical protein
MFHSQFKPFGPQPIREHGAWPKFPNPPVWPKPLLGRALEWRYVDGGGMGHTWIVREAVDTGFRFHLWGDRVWAEVGTSPEAIGEQAVAKVLTAAIGRAFSGPDSPQPGRESEISLWRDDFIQAGLVAE